MLFTLLITTIVYIIASKFYDRDERLLALVQSIVIGLLINSAVSIFLLESSIHRTQVTAHYYNETEFTSKGIKLYHANNNTVTYLDNEKLHRTSFRFRDEPYLLIIKRDLISQWLIFHPVLKDYVITGPHVSDIN